MVFERFKNFFRRVHLKLLGPRKRSVYMRKYMHHVGENVYLYTIHFGTEPYLISLHDNCVCAADVKFVTHDISVFNLRRLNKQEALYDKVGSIVLYENCFVGAYTILMPNTSVGKNSIVACGSVVTKHIPDNEVWGGNPAHFIMSTSDYLKKTIEANKSYPWIKNNQFIGSESLVKNERIKYFFNEKENEETL